jgi:hypothetical protein
MSRSLPVSPPIQPPTCKKRRAPNHADNPTDYGNPRCIQHGCVSLWVETVEQLNAENTERPNRDNANDESDDAESQHQPRADDSCDYKHSNVSEMCHARDAA